MVRLYPVNLRELGKRPSAMDAKMVHTRHPICVHRGFLLLRILATIAFDFDNEMERICLPTLPANLNRLLLAF
jgi:hypothetical protein